MLYQTKKESGFPRGDRSPFFVGFSGSLPTEDLFRISVHEAGGYVLNGIGEDAIRDGLSQGLQHEIQGGLPVLGGKPEQLLAGGVQFIVRASPIGVLTVVGGAGYQLGVKLTVLLSFVEVEAKSLGLGREGLQVRGQPRNQLLFHGSVLSNGRFYALTNSE